MRVLVADDDPDSSNLSCALLRRMSHDPRVVDDGQEALDILTSPDAPSLAIVDWMMPGIDGLEVCRRLRAQSRAHYTYVILLTARCTKEDVVAGLEAGADDFISKPVDLGEFRSRLRVGERVVELETSLQQRVVQLEAALAEVKTLQGLLPICMYCKCIRDEDNRWQRLENYLAARSDATFSHGICNKCMEHHYPERRSGTDG